jgi:hypothetical protein
MEWKASEHRRYAIGHKQFWNEDRKSNNRSIERLFDRQIFIYVFTYQRLLSAELLQKTARGFKGDPIPFSILSGAAMKRNS